MKENIFNQINGWIKECMAYEQYAFVHRLQSLKNAGNKNSVDLEGALLILMEAVEKSKLLRKSRELNRPKVMYSDPLPIVKQRDAIMAAISNNPVVIVAGETGSGKSTQLPKFCLEMGRGAGAYIGHTQPRRVAARSVSQRIAQELQSPLGQYVGYKVRFQDKITPHSYIKMMTDGILLAEIHHDHFLAAYDTLIIDEVHERTLNIDFLLGYLKRIVTRRRDLKVIVTSATIDVKRLSHFFNHAPVIEVSGRTYPVEVRYRPVETDTDTDEPKDRQQAIVAAIEEILSLEVQGDILIFFSGEAEIHETMDHLRKQNFFIPVEILALYSRLSAAEQDRIFTPGTQLRIILTTNIAETSITVPGVKYVIDGGFARIGRYSPRSKIQRLPVEKISQASANQRKGRCGRIAPGVCIRLYDEMDFLQRPEYTEAEILRSNLATVVLRMKSLKLEPIEEFPLVDAPEPRLIQDGIRLLKELKAVDAEGRLSPLGKKMALLPVDPQISALVLAARQYLCLKEVLIIAAALSIQDPRERPAAHQQDADTCHAQFADPQSDFLALLKLWQHLQQQNSLSKNQLKKYCRDHFLSYLRWLEWQDVHRQLQDAVIAMGMRINQVAASYDALHRALLAGLLSNTAYKSAQYEYTGARNSKLYLHPSSSLFKLKSQWIMAAEIIETSRVYARTVAKIEPEWIAEVGQHLLKNRYYDASWDKDKGIVTAFLDQTLYGLPVAVKKTVNYGPIDPLAAREVFISRALVADEMNFSESFIAHNQAIIAAIHQTEMKLRQPNLLLDEQSLFELYAAHLPRGIYDFHSFIKWHRAAPAPELQALFFSKEQLLKNTTQWESLLQYPEYLTVKNYRLKLNYYFEPGHSRDGVTVSLPLHLLNQFEPRDFEFLVAGILKNKLLYLLKSLPKDLRKFIVPIPDWLESIFAEITPQKGSLLVQLNHLLSRKAGIQVDISSWREDKLPEHLRMNFQIVDEQQQVVDLGRDLSALQYKYQNQARQQFQHSLTWDMETAKSRSWVFGQIPEQVTMQVQGQAIQGYPALVDAEDGVMLKVLDEKQKASSSHRGGLSRLFLLNLPDLSKEIKKLLKAKPQLLRLGQTTATGEDYAQILSAKIVEKVFLNNAATLRDDCAFQQTLAQGKPLVYGEINSLVALLETIYALSEAIQKALQACAAKAPTASCQDMRDQLSRLVQQKFIQDTPMEWLVHYPRYLKALSIRLKKYDEVPQRDARLLQQIQPLWLPFWKSIAAKPVWSEAQLQFRWQLEELRISLFAQEIKTHIPVSPQKLLKMLQNVIT